jgi:hypothetical protein
MAMALDSRTPRSPAKLIRRCLLIAAIALFGSLAVSGCNARSSSEFNWGLWSRGGMRASVSGTRTDSDYRATRAKEGEVLVIDYDIEVDRGALVVSVSRPLLAGGKTVWWQQFEHGKKGQKRIAIEQSGSYEVWVMQKRFGGRYDIKWDTE